MGVFVVTLRVALRYVGHVDERVGNADRSSSHRGLRTLQPPSPGQLSETFLDEVSGR